MFPAPLAAQAQRLLETCRQRKITIVTAESCTGGLISALLTEIPGSSAVFERGFVTYANEAKEASLGVSPQLLTRYGAVSAEVATAMAAGALEHSGARLALAVTGIAGPDGGTAQKPVGLVYIAAGMQGNAPQVTEHHFSGGRGEVRLAAVRAALGMAEEIIG